MRRNAFRMSDARNGNNGRRVTMKKRMTLSVFTWTTTVLLLCLLVSPPDLVSQYASRNGPILSCLPWGIEWDDSFAEIREKVSDHDSTIGRMIRATSDGRLALEEAPFSKFTGSFTLSRGTDGESIAVAQWRFTGTRVLSPIGIYDFLLPALVAELGDPVDRQESSVRDTLSFVDWRRNDHHVTQALRTGEHFIYSQWRLERKDVVWPVDFRIEKRTGHTVLSIVNETAVAMQNDETDLGMA